MKNRIECVGVGTVENLWIVHFNEKKLGTFISEAGAQAFLDFLENPIKDDLN